MKDVSDKFILAIVIMTSYSASLLSTTRLLQMTQDGTLHHAGRQLTTDLHQQILNHSAEPTGSDLMLAEKLNYKLSVRAGMAMAFGKLFATSD